MKPSTVCLPISDRAARLLSLLICTARNGVVEGPDARRKVLAGRLRWSVDKFDKAAKELAEAELVRIESCFNADGWQDGNRWVLLDPIEPIEPFVPGGAS